MEVVVVTTDAAEQNEVAESDASPVVHAVYDDVKSTLRTPSVNALFRRLAIYPDFLQLAWRQLRPNVEIQYFENGADEIRSVAVSDSSPWSTGAPNGNTQTVDALKIFHYLNPKLLLIVTTLRAAVNGQYPKLQELTAPEKRQVPRGIPATAVIDETDPNDTNAEVQRILSDMTPARASVFSDVFRALGRSPEYFVSARSFLQTTDQPEYRPLERRLRLLAEETAQTLPFRVEINPHIMRLCGASERDIDDIRQTLDTFYKLLPSLIIDVSRLATSAFGPQVATTSPFPVEER